MKTLMYSLVILSGLSLLFFSSCQDKQTKEELLKYRQKEEREASNIEIIKRFFKFYDELNLEECSNLMAPDNKFYTNSEPWVFKDAIPLAPTLFSVFPNFNFLKSDPFSLVKYITLVYCLLTSSIT